MNRLDLIELRIGALENARDEDARREYEAALHRGEDLRRWMDEWERDTRPAGGDGPLVSRMKGKLREALPAEVAAERRDVHPEDIGHLVELPSEIEQRGADSPGVTDAVFEGFARRENGAIGEPAGVVEGLSERVVSDEDLRDDSLRPVTEALIAVAVCLVVFQAAKHFTRRGRRL